MSENAPETPAPQPQEGTPEGPAEQPQTFDADYVANLRKEAAKYRTEAKAAAAELEKTRTASLSEAEKAVADAEKRGEQKAAQQWSQRLVRSDFVAAASRRNPEFDAASVLDDLNLSRFVGEDGEPDGKAITAAVERLVPAPDGRGPSFDGGARTTAPASTGMNGLIRSGVRR